MSGASRRALFLDRDGVINVDHGYVGERERFVFQEGLFPVLRMAADAGLRLVVITNQSGIARGYYSLEAFAALTAWMEQELARAGVPLTGVFFCPCHRVGNGSPFDRDSYWRKPQPGMIASACQVHGLDPAGSVFLGDQPSDIQAAAAAGVGQALFLRHDPTSAAVPPACRPPGYQEVGSLAQAAVALEAWLRRELPAGAMG